VIEELAKQLHWLRAGGIAATALMLLTSLMLHIPLAYDTLLIICLQWLVLHGFIVFSQRRWQITVTSISLQLSADMIIVASLLAVSGGVHNPFFGLLLLPLLLAVGILPSRQQVGLLVLALIASTLLIFVPTPLKSTTPIIPNALYELLFWLDGGIVKQTPFNPLDVLAKVGLWLNLGLTAILVTFFLSRLHQRLQQQQLALQEAQLDRQSQQHLLSMSLAAAATAHELSTPLASISLLAAEASDAFHHQETEVAHSSLHQIQRLVGHCKKQISDSLKQHQLERSEQLALMPWTGYVEQLLLQWKTLGPQVNVVFSKQGNHLREPNVINLPILSQSISCLLNNASDASHEPLAVKLSWTIDEVVLCIHNQGEGFPEALLAAFPQPQMSDKTEGHGVGLALAHANISQLGGQLRLFNPAQGGAQACIILPNQIEHWQLRQNVTQQKTSMPS